MFINDRINKVFFYDAGGFDRNCLRGKWVILLSLLSTLVLIIPEYTGWSFLVERSHELSSGYAAFLGFALGMLILVILIPVIIMFKAFYESIKDVNTF